MGSETQPQLPIIDLSEKNINPGSSSWLSTCHDVTSALETYGCFVAVLNDVFSEVHEAAFSVVKDFFELPRETKIKNTGNPNKPHYGYLGNTIPVMESFGIENAPALEEAQRFTNLNWPAGNEHFCETVHSYAKIVSELEQKVRRMVFQSYGVEKYYDSNIKSTDYVFRVNKYKRTNMQETNIGLLPHTDRNFMTIISVLDEGLDIKARDGNWIGVRLSPLSFLVMAGETFLAWSNDRIHAPLHRVLMSGKPDRYSLMLMVSCNGTIEVPEELVDDEHPLKFKPFDQFTFLNLSSTKDCKQAGMVWDLYGLGSFLNNMKIKNQNLW